MTMEIRHYRAFLVLAEENNLTRAAEKLHLSQPALSRTLAQLEQHLGGRLVSRSTHHFELTSAGQWFLVGAKEAVAAFDRATQAVVGDIPTLRVGQGWAVGTHMTVIVRAWQKAYPDRPFDVRHSEDRAAGLTRRQVDAALTRGPLDPKRFAWTVVAEERRMAVLPADHRLAGRSSVTLADLASEHLVIIPMASLTTPELWPADNRPSVVTEVSTMQDWLLAVATGAGIGVTVESTAVLYPHPEIRFVPVIDTPHAALLLAWPRSDRHPYVDDFVRIALAVS
jgi:DNA-binding transcriptional LysR family regulator